MHPNALFARENGILPQHIGDKQLTCFGQRCFDNITRVFLCVESKDRFKFPQNFPVIPSFSRSIDKLRILCKKMNQLFRVEPLESGEETIESK